MLNQPSGKLEDQGRDPVANSDVGEPRSLAVSAQRELQWIVATFAKTFLTLITIRTVAALARATPFPVRPAWGSKPATPDTPQSGVPMRSEPYARMTDDHEQPTLLFRADGLSFFQHDDRHPGQRWPCPILDEDPCRDCRWLVITSRGSSECAARAMVALRNHPRFQGLGIEDVRDLVHEDDPALRVWLD